jgi:hypothetical protein
MPNTNTRTFSCHDLESSAFLWARGVRFLGLQSAPTARSPQHVIFAFDDSDGSCQQELLAYEGGAEIPARQFAIALKMLKDQLFKTKTTNPIQEYTLTHDNQRSKQFS